jgi:hypothetical protein
MSGFRGSMTRVARCARMMLLLAVVSVFAATVADAATVRGRLVHGANGYPAEGLAVTVNHYQYGRSPPSFSGPDGMFYLNGIPPGNYILEIWVTPQNFISINITVNDPVTDIYPVRVP